MTRLSKLALFASAATLTAGAAAAGDATRAEAHAKTGMDAMHAERALDRDVQTSLGVTVGQIDNADLITADGDYLGDVEAVLTNSAGDPEAVLIQLDRGLIEADDESRYVKVGFDTLETRADDDFINLWDDRVDLVTSQTPDAIAAMERWNAKAYSRAEIDADAAAESRMTGEERRDMSENRADTDSMWRSNDDLANELRERNVADRDMETTLGVTVAQINDADLVNEQGEELGEVEAVLRGETGEADSVLVELETGLFEEDRLVEIQLSELSTRADDQWINLWDEKIDLVTTQTPESLGEMRDWRFSENATAEVRTASN